MQHCYSKLKNLETDIFQKRQLDFALGPQKLADLEVYKEEAQMKISSKTKERHKKKFDNLLAERSHPESYGSRRVVNLSTKQLDESHILALSKGLNFAPAPKKIPTAHLVATIEAAIRSGVSETVAVKTRMSVIGSVSRARMPLRNVPPKEMRALKDLASDEDILILPPDKGKATVAMNKADYDTKMMTMLKDENTYRPVKKDPTSSLERNMNSMLLSLKRSGRLPDGVYSYLSSAGSTSQLYGLPKVHKQDVPLRPIVSFVSSSTYRLSRFLANLLPLVVGQSSSHGVC